MVFIMPPHTLTNFEIQKYYENDGVYLMVFILETIQNKEWNGANVINLDEYADVGTHWIVLFCNRSEIVYFDSFGVQHVPEDVK